MRAVRIGYAPPMATPPSAPSPAAKAPRRSLAGWLLRLFFGGRRALLTLPLLLLLGYLGWRSTVYLYYRGASQGSRTGVITKVSYKGSPLCRYESVEMRVGQATGQAVLNAETWEFTVDADYAWLIPKLTEAEKSQKKVTVTYRQDTWDVEAKPAPPLNLPWRFCVTTSYHATGIETE